MVLAGAFMGLGMENGCWPLDWNSDAAISKISELSDDALLYREPTLGGGNWVGCDGTIGRCIDMGLESR